MWIGIGLLVGLLIGSLVDCLASRATTTKSFWGRSYCDRCKMQLKWYDLFPVVSFLLLGGKCRYCHKNISWESTSIEVGYALLIAGLIFTNIPVDFLTLALPQLSLVILDLVFKIFVVAVLGVLFITDIKTGLIPDRVSLPSILIILIYLVVTSVYKVFLLYQSLSANLIGRYLLPPHSDYFTRHVLLTLNPLFTSLGAAILIGLFFATLIIITRGRGMGGGDLKLGIFIGLALGLPGSILALFLAFVLGSIVGVILLLFRRKQFGQTIPFGPFLSMGSYLTLIVGKQLIESFLKF